MSKPTKVPGIPKPPPSLDPATRQYLEVLAEAVEIRLGRRGDPKDRAVTLRELIDSGLAVDLKSTQFDPNNPNSSNIGMGPVGSDTEVNLTAPPIPTSFLAAGAYSQIILSWDYPSYSNHSFTEIYGHSNDTIGDAQLVGVSTGRVYIDPVGESFTRYYWIRHVSTASVVGPFNSSTGTTASTATNVDQLLNELQGSIPAVAFATGLEPISVVNSLPSTSGYTGPSVVLLSTDGKLYRLVSGSWTAAVPTGDLSGTIGASQIAANAVTANKIQAGAVQAGAIAAGAINATNIIADDTIIGDKIAANTITGANIQASSVNANVLTAGSITSNEIATNTIDASKIKLDGTSITSNAAGQIVIGSIVANSIQSGTLNAGLITVTNLYADNIAGDINTLVPFSLASPVQITGGDTQVWAGQFPAQTIAKKPYISAVGFGIWENDVVYKVDLQMKVNSGSTTSTVGTVVSATSTSWAFGTFYIVTFSGDKLSVLPSGAVLKVGSTNKGTVNWATYNSSTNVTQVNYYPTSGGLATGQTVTSTPIISYQTVSTIMFRADYDDHPEPFAITGGLSQGVTATVDARIMIDTLSTNYQALPSVPNNTNWAHDQVFDLDGLMMSLR
jgi:hypothetical protein